MTEPMTMKIKKGEHMQGMRISLSCPHCNKICMEIDDEREEDTDTPVVSR